MRPSSMSPGHVHVARVAYVAVILLATLSNLHFDPTVADVAPRLQRALNLSPHMSDAIDAARNVLLFAGLGVVWIATSRLIRTSKVLLTLTLLSLVLSGCVETLQLFSPIREASLLDVTTDTIGGLVGGLITLGAFAVASESAGKRSYVGVPAVVFAAAYGLATVMEAFIPLFRQDLLPNLGGSIGERIGRAVVAVRPESVTQFPVIDTLIFFPAGVFGVAALIEGGVSRWLAVWIVIFAAVVIYPAVEVMHGVASMPIIIGAALAHVVGVAAGAIAAGLLLRTFSSGVHSRTRANIAAVAYSLAIMVWSWRPFRLDLSTQSMADQFTASHLLPLQALSSRGDLFTVTDVVAQGVLFLPLGALLAVWPVRSRGWMRGLLPAVLLAIVLEVGKIPLAERFMDVTHILIQSAGAAVGFLLLRRTGYQPHGELLGED